MENSASPILTRFKAWCLNTYYEMGAGSFPMEEEFSSSIWNLCKPSKCSGNPGVES